MRTSRAIYFCSFEESGSKFEVRVQGAFERAREGTTPSFLSNKINIFAIFALTAVLASGRWYFCIVHILRFKVFLGFAMESSHRPTLPLAAECVWSWYDRISLITFARTVGIWRCGENESESVAAVASDKNLRIKSALSLSLPLAKTKRAFFRQ